MVTLIHLTLYNLCSSNSIVKYPMNRVTYVAKFILHQKYAN